MTTIAEGAREGVRVTMLSNTLSSKGSAEENDALANLNDEDPDILESNNATEDIREDGEYAQEGQATRVEQPSENTDHHGAPRNPHDSVKENLEKEEKRDPEPGHETSQYTHDQEEHPNNAEQAGNSFMHT
jgi:hypothetical protein